MQNSVKLTFSDYFGVNKKILEKEGYFDISLLSDLPLFIDPFNLFYSKKPEYQKLHEEMIKYLVFLRDLSVANAGSPLSGGIVDSYYKFPEIKQNWFGFTFMGNSGHGLGISFARSLNESFSKLFKDFGIKTKTSHLEKLTLVANRVGKDTISDFTTNLIVGFLAEKTEEFSSKYLPAEMTKPVIIRKASFDYSKKVWIPKSFNLPFYDGDYILLTPRDLLTKGETWINKKDFYDSFSGIPDAIPNPALREQLSSFFRERIREFSERKIDKKTKKVRLVETGETRAKATMATVREFPVVIDVYIKIKEDTGEKAMRISEELVTRTERLFEEQFRSFANTAGLQAKRPTSYDELFSRVKYFKECVELRGCYRYFYDGDAPVDEDWIQGMFWFSLYGTESDVNREPKTGSGNPDFTGSQGRRDKTIVEFKLAKSSSLEKNLLNQLEKYKEVEKTDKGIWVIVFFTPEEEAKVKKILKKHGLENDPNYVLVDARKDNKQSASKIG